MTVELLPGRGRSTREGYLSIRALGGAPSRADNAAIVAKANALGRPLYIDDGDYTTSVMPTVPVLGEGRIVFTGGDLEAETIRVASIPGYLNSIVQGIGTAVRQRQLNLITGQDSGLELDHSTAYGIVGFGPQVFKKTTGGRRSTGLGRGAFRDVKAPVNADAIGDSVAQCTDFIDRSHYAFSNAGKWSGCADPVGKLHDFFIAGHPAGDARYSADWADWRTGANVGPVEGPAGLFATSSEDNYGNIGMGRDTLIHNVVGRFFTATGVHGPRGWDLSYGTSYGGRTGGFLLYARNVDLQGYNLAPRLQTADDVVAMGTQGLARAVHLKNGIYIGTRIALALWGDSYDRATAAGATEDNVMVGNDIATLMAKGKRNALQGNSIARSALYIEDSSLKGYRVFNLATGIRRCVADGYRAGDLMEGDVENVVLYGPNAQARGSNTGKIGNGLTDLGLSGRVFSTRSQTAISDTTGITLTTEQIFQGRITRTGPSADFADTLPTAALVVAAIPGCEVGTAFETNIWNNSAFVQTVAAGTGVTLGRSIVLKSGAFMRLRGRVTSIDPGSETYTVTFEHPGTLFLNNASLDKPTLYSERSGSGVHAVFIRNGTDKGSFNVTTTAISLNGVGAAPQIGYGATAAAATPYWQLEIAGSGPVLGAWRPVTDGGVDIGTAAAAINGMHLKAVPFASLPPGTTPMMMVVSNGNVDPVGNYGAAVTGEGSFVAFVQRYPDGIWRIG